MNSAKVWLQWVRHGKAYTITKSRRKAVRRERLRIVALFWGYTILLIEQKRTRISFYCNREKKCREELFKEYEFINADKFNLYADQVHERESHRTLGILCEIIHGLYFYNECRDEEREMEEYLIRGYMKELKTPYAGAIARRTFKEIETKLIEAVKIGSEYGRK